MAESRESPEAEAGRHWYLLGLGRTADSSVPQLLVHHVGVIITPASWGCVRSKSQCVPSAWTSSWQPSALYKQHHSSEWDTGVVLLFKHSYVPRKWIFFYLVWFLGEGLWLRGKESLPIEETQVRSLGWEDSLQEEMVTHSSIIAKKIPWTEEPEGLQSVGSQRVRHDRAHTGGGGRHPP